LKWERIDAQFSWRKESFFLFSDASQSHNNKRVDSKKMYQHNGVKITWLGHDGFRIQEGSESLVVDPFKLDHEARADYLLISHEHYDHCNADDIRKVLKPNTTVVAIPACKQELEKAGVQNLHTIKPGESLKIGEYEVRAVPAYNTNKFKEPGRPFHPKSDGKVGYVIKTKSGTTIYHTGDTDLIPEMDNLKPDIALLPVSGTYVMTAEEALQAADRIKPKLVIPMHWGTIVGSKNDAEYVKKNAKVQVEILAKE
jgi:L-ascorbate metabolism protein UlaG (beta-lactamase superfamily)